ncbi:MAG: hypothetical protein O3B86_01420 [Planctomycetota bacterium]|nr:hypothetical protein [Planctomycetota bacterium]
MTEPLQKFGWKQSQYERPAHGWVCGHLCDGSPCQFGPTSRGQCQVQNLCQPEKSGDRYICSRAVAFGGVCKEGPLPDGTCCQQDTACQPRRSLFHQRRLVSCSVTALSIAFCLYVFGGHPPSGAMSPGNVTFQHSSLEHECWTCHVAAGKNGTEFAVHSFDTQTAIADSNLCMKCHPEIGSEPFLPHSVAHAELVNFGQQSKETTSGESSSGVIADSGRPMLLSLASLFKGDAAVESHLACSTCHQEHRGKLHELTRLADLQCQSCHSKQFHSFQDGHPELADFAYSRRPRIYFDHSKHLQQYFVTEEFYRVMPDGKSPTSCVACHEPDTSGTLMQTRGFEQMCAGCHEREISDRESPGIAFLSIPSLTVDSAAMPDVSVGLGQWPVATIDPPLSPLPHFMQMLLETDAEYLAAQVELGELAPRNLSIALAETPAVAVNYLWGIKRLFHDLAVNGDVAFKRRLNDRFPTLAEMEPSIVPSAVSAARLWFSRLNDEVIARSQGSPLPIAELSAGENSRLRLTPDSVMGGGWYIRESDHTVRYRPVGHSDPLLKTLLDVAVGRLSPDASPDAVSGMLAQLVSPSGSGDLSSRGPVASGRCLQCHTVDRNPKSGTLGINWNARRPGEKSSPLTAFSHSPHMKLLTEDGCISCHQVSRTASTDSAYRSEFFTRSENGHQWMPQTDWKVSLASGFDAISKARCIECHTDSSAGESCLKCHSYHAGSSTHYVADFWRRASSLERVGLPKRPDSSSDAAESP